MPNIEETPFHLLPYGELLSKLRVLSAHLGVHRLRLSSYLADHDRHS